MNHETAGAPATRVETPARTDPPGGADVWERALPLWHVYNGVVVALTALIVYPSGGLTGAEVPIATAILAGLVILYTRLWIVGSMWEATDRTRVAWGVVVLVAFAALQWMAPAFAFLQFALYAQLFFTMPSPALAIVAGLCIGPILAVTELAHSGWDLAAAGGAMIANIIGATAFTMLSAWIGAIIAQSHDRKQLLLELEATREDLAAAEREAGALEERARLSREIHDTLAQGFASVVTLLEAADGVLATNQAKAREHIHGAEAVARASLEEARGLVWTLRPRTLEDGGLPAAIERVAATAASSAPSTRVSVRISGAFRTLHPDVEVAILRTAQEALSNAVRHAGASTITLTLTYFDDEVSLDVIDDGSGFDPASVAAPTREGGHGLPGMRERAEHLGGRLDVESGPGEGTAIALALPAPSPPAGGGA
ncbi:MAG TPA: sensor histidine kinase [Candidatus Limnocylindrales bacterium]|nr:sensor histidine kinase [Candidatus Limnocylindrales bacterium]